MKVYYLSSVEICNVLSFTKNTKLLQPTKWKKMKKDNHMLLESIKTCRKQWTLKPFFFSLIVNSTKTTFFFSILDLSAPAVHIWKLQYFIRVYRKLVSKTRLYIIETSKMLYWWSYWWSSLVRMSESRFLKRCYVEN